MTTIPPLPGNFITPAYTYGAARNMYEIYGFGRRQPRPAVRPQVFTEIDGMRRINFDKGSFEVYL